jgi:uncharacterized membrane protein YqiK
MDDLFDAILDAIYLIAVLIYIVLLIFSMLLEWFQQYKYLANRNNNVAVTVKTKLASGDHGLVQGIFDTNTEQFVEGRVIQYDTLDSKTKDAHRFKELVVWQ